MVDRFMIALFKKKPRMEDEKSLYVEKLKERSRQKSDYFKLLKDIQLTHRGGGQSRVPVDSNLFISNPDSTDYQINTIFRNKNKERSEIRIIAQ